jgi:predicted Holliday junction resolvase-like endonuclease
MELIIGLLIICIAILGYQLFRVNIKVEHRAREQYENWKRNDYEYIKREQREIAVRETKASISDEITGKAREQYENWQTREIERISSEQKEFAKQEADFLLKQWIEENSKLIRIPASTNPQLKI